jgi:isopentenyl-diphosphate delta-isomerase
MTGPAPERVVLLDSEHREIGAAPKSEVHTANTPLHLAFSCHVFNPAGQVLVTRRALDKKAWPGVWTNSVCGHPGPGEPIADAVRRRADYELGLELQAISTVLPDFSYRAVDASGVVENEFCPVHFSLADGEPRPRASEVSEHLWVEPAALETAAAATPWAFSPWMVWQLRQFAARGIAYRAPQAG